MGQDHLWGRVVGSGPGNGGYPHLFGGSAPTCPQQEKMAKISHFQQIFEFIHQKSILLLQCPHKNISGATTGSGAGVIWWGMIEQWGRID